MIIPPVDYPLNRNSRLGTDQQTAVRNRRSHALLMSVFVNTRLVMHAASSGMEQLVAQLVQAIRHVHVVPLQMDSVGATNSHQKSPLLFSPSHLKRQSCTFGDRD
ncbi:hypothetical protein BLNAU_14885 [Blattamonas nauphoetae]|uniref:Uncharacterized protein n=1 Tax=Blattamonas nauphoetae TaxID=2049346 RepID=A0ABQ9XH74_9EUKA|nr:hypothetical protein BLNAU_14885 [Blattamonas nauphoetae]